MMTYIKLEEVPLVEELDVETLDQTASSAGAGAGEGEGEAPAAETEPAAEA